MTTDLMGDVCWCAADDFYVARRVESDCASGFLTEFITAGSVVCFMGLNIRGTWGAFQSTILNIY